MAAQVASVLGFAEEPVAERNPIAAAFGFPGAYWWEADYNLQQPHRYASFDAGSVSGTPERRPLDDSKLLSLQDAAAVHDYPASGAPRLGATYRREG